MARLSLATLVWGFVTGVAMVNSGMPVGIGLLTTLTVFAGSAQLAALPLLAAGAPLWVVWATALVVNLRFVIFSAASRPAFVSLTFRQRLLAGYLNGDLGFSLFSLRFAEDPRRGTPEQWGYFYGGAAVFWAEWQVASIVGVLVGGLAPRDWGLEFVAYLVLVAVLVPLSAGPPAFTGVLVAAAVSLAAVHLPMRLGLLVAVAAGLAAAVAAEWVLAYRRDSAAPGEVP